MMRATIKQFIAESLTLTLGFGRFKRINMNEPTIKSIAYSRQDIPLISPFSAQRSHTRWWGKIFRAASSPNNLK